MCKFGTLKLSQSLNNGQYSDECISDFRISGQSLMKANCHDSRASDNIGPVTELDKRNKIM